MILYTESMPDFWASVLTFAHRVTGQVGAQLLTEFGQVPAEAKSDGSLVTQSDKWADQVLQEAISTTFPTHGLLSEESEHVLPSNEWCWVIDPIDGTTNFARGLPIWAISLGLLYQGTPVFGFVQVPPLQQALYGFWAAPEQDNGAFLNQRAMQTCTDPPTGSHFFSLCARSTVVMQHPFPCKIRMLGSASYNLLTVAIGSTLGAVEATPKIWDIAGAWPIIHAAGGAWISLNDKPIFPLKAGQDYSAYSYPTLVVSQPQWAETFLPLVRPVIS